MASLAEQITACARNVTGVVWVASASLNGEPHLALCTELEMLDDSRAQLTGFCCLQTVDNLRENPRMSIGVWNSKQNEGWQIVGAVETIEASAVSEAPADDAVEYKLVLTVREALHLAPGQHSDSAV